MKTKSTIPLLLVLAIAMSTIQAVGATYVSPITTGDYHQIECLTNTLPEKNVFYYRDYYFGSHGSSLDYATECGEPLILSRSEMMAANVILSDVPYSGQVKFQLYTVNTNGAETHLSFADLNIYVNTPSASVVAWWGRFNDEITAPGKYRVKFLSPWTSTITKDVYVGTCLADLNGDGTVGIGDAVVLTNNWGKTPSDPTWNAIWDMNKDDVVGIGDSVVLTNNWGATCNYP